MIQTRYITSTHLGTGGMFGSRGNKLNRTSSGAEKSKMVGRVRIKPAADCAGALCDTEILSLVLHPVILWCSARAKSLWMGFNSSFFVFPLGEVMKRVRGMTTVGAAGESFLPNKP